MIRGSLTASQPEIGLRDKLWQINWGIVLVLAMVAGIGLAALYSAANGHFNPWAARQLVHFSLGAGLMMLAALVDIRTWMRLAYPFYVFALLLLVVVDVAGHVGMGAQRWINLGFIQIQPSEIMKIAMVMVLARQFHGLAYEDVGRPLLLIVPTLLVFVPVGLVMKQPDLGTAMMLVMVGGVIFFLAGVRWWKFAIVAAAGAGAVPVAWRFLHGYQKKRILTFLHPENDPLGAGYHIMQSKIALGSGGLFGKGFMMGTQSHLNFLPEKQTDFIFTMLAEEWGMVGGVTLLALYILLVAYAMVVGLRSRNQFGRLLAIGLGANLFLYVFINMAMVMGLVPVVGVPLPLISYGGTSVLTVLFGFGLIMSADLHRDERIPRWAGDL